MWERNGYYIHYRNGDDHVYLKGKIRDLIADLGELGWELVNVVNYSVIATKAREKVSYYFKCPKQE